MDCFAPWNMLKSLCFLIQLIEHADLRLTKDLTKDHGRTYTDVYVDQYSDCPVGWQVLKDDVIIWVESSQDGGAKARTRPLAQPRAGRQSISTPVSQTVQTSSTPAQQRSNSRILQRRQRSVDDESTSITQSSSTIQSNPSLASPTTLSPIARTIRDRLNPLHHFTTLKDTICTTKLVNSNKPPLPFSSTRASPLETMATNRDRFTTTADPVSPSSTTLTTWYTSSTFLLTKMPFGPQPSTSQGLTSVTPDAEYHDDAVIISADGGDSSDEPTHNKDPRFETTHNTEPDVKYWYVKPFLRSDTVITVELQRRKRCIKWDNTNKYLVGQSNTGASVSTQPYPNNWVILLYVFTLSVP